MAGRECYHCKQWVEEGEAHDCWTTTEAALTQDLSEDLRGAWERLRETAVSFGEQRIYASHQSIMFSRTSCYFFVRPKRHFLELCVFLGRALKAPQVRRVVRASKSKLVHVIQIRHRDEVEAPITDWLQKAYELSDVLAAKTDSKRTRSKAKTGSTRKKAKAARPKAPGAPGAVAVRTSSPGRARDRNSASTGPGRAGDGPGASRRPRAHSASARRARASPRRT